MRRGGDGSLEQLADLGVGPRDQVLRPALPANLANLPDRLENVGVGGGVGGGGGVARVGGEGAEVEVPVAFSLRRC